MAKVIAVLVAAALLLVVSPAMRAGGAAAAQQCDLSTLSPCSTAFTFGGTPSPTCCTKLREEEQKGCLCVYGGFFLNSTTVRNALVTCDVAFPTC